MSRRIETAVNPKNKGDKCFQYPVTVTLNHEEIGKHPQIA